MSMEDCDELLECAATDAAITAAEAGLRQGGGLHPAEEAFAEETLWRRKRRC